MKDSDFLIGGFTDWEEAISKVARIHLALYPQREGSQRSRDWKRAEAAAQETRAQKCEQRPAAYRFTTAGYKIDVLPEAPEALDRQLAADTRQELLAKARQLLARLHNSRSAQRVCDSVQRLLEALDVCCRWNDLLDQAKRR